MPNDAPERSAAAEADLSARTAILDNLARRYGSVLARFFARRIDRRDDVSDLVQDVFLRLSRLKDLASIEKPEQYLFATAASALKDRARRSAHRQERLHDPFAEAEHGGSDLSMSRVLETRDIAARLEAALRGLPERTRDVFVLRVLEEQKLSDIAHALGISVRAVEKHQVRALAHVASRLGSPHE